eukprot:scaffold39152_cov40-Tisochrysis_lutea.AAC.2
MKKHKRKEDTWTRGANTASSVHSHPPSQQAQSQRASSIKRGQRGVERARPSTVSHYCASASCSADADVLREPETIGNMQTWPTQWRH